MRIHVLFVTVLLVTFSCTAPDDRYTLVIEGYDWGPAANKVILPLEKETSSTEGLEFSVQVQRKAECEEIKPEDSEGERRVVSSYVSDARGNPTAKGKHITLELEVSPDLPLSNPFYYSDENGCTGSDWTSMYSLQVHEKTKGWLWTEEKNRIIPLVDEFNLDGVFRFGPDLEMNYAYFSPTIRDAPVPLIIWLHGGGEGGYDTTIPLLANRAANYASEEIQKFFGGAHVLVPQCPGAWMQNQAGEVTWGRDNDRYNEALIELIKEFVRENPSIDPDRIYVGGCSNGGYMSLKLIMLHPDYFAAGFISALAYKSEFISDSELERIKDVPLWFIHSKDDETTRPEETVVPVYNRLKSLGAKDIHFSYFDHVTDITGDYGGQAYHYSGHWSWIYSHTNKAILNSQGQPVESLEGEPSIMDWLATQSVQR
jgi:poly(3-hydroxybutyrate) depolymerase